MLKRDCYWYHCEHEMGASIDCCTLMNELGNCPCSDNCHNYVSNKEVTERLKAQGPRVMTVSEIGTLDNGCVIWVEFSDGQLLPMIVEDGCLMRWRYLWRICEDAFHDEDYQARAWSGRPTDEQREATPWVT